MEFIIIYTLGLICACAFSAIIIPKILLISIRKFLYDLPDERKVHKKPVSRLGGVAFFPGILFTLTLILSLCNISEYWIFNNFNNNFSEFLLFLNGTLILYLVGIKDDLVGVLYRKKLIIQFLAALMIPISGLYINDLYGIFGIHSISAWVGIPLTIILVIFITNAINFIDGIDGLASGISILALGVYCILFIFTKQFLFGFLSIVSLGVLIPFFFYNVFGNTLNGRKIFMGDTGSLTLGFILSFITVKYIMNSYPSGNINSDGAILIAFCILLVPGLDVVRVVLKRLRRKKSPFIADKTHIHHKFLAMGYTARQSLIIILAMSFGFCVANLVLISYVENTILLFADILLWTGLNIWFDKVIENRKIH